MKVTLVYRNKSTIHTDQKNEIIFSFHLVFLSDYQNNFENNSSKFYDVESFRTLAKERHRSIDSMIIIGIRPLLCG